MSRPPTFPADLLARYTMGECIASGGFGAVYHATRTASGDRVAVKLLHPAVEEDPDQVKRFVAEARVVAKLDHPNIVRLRDHGMGDDPAQPRPWIAYELAAGKCVIEMLEAGSIPLAQALAITRQTAAALTAAHAAGVVHRDIKPDNIVEVEPGRYALIDFGIALWNDPARVYTATGLMLATPAYVAPEVIGGAPADALSDQYSLGVTLYQLLSRRLPFEDESLPALLDAHVSRPVPPLAERGASVPEWVEAVTLRALAKKAEERFGSVAELAAALTPAGSPTEVRAEAKPGVRTVPPARGARARTVAADGPAAPRVGAPVTRSSATTRGLVVFGAILVGCLVAGLALRGPSEPVAAPSASFASVGPSGGTSARASVGPPAGTVPTSPGASGAVPRAERTLADDGAALLAAPPLAVHALSFTRRLRQARAAGQPLEAIRAGWTEVHDGARWLLDWGDAILRHEQSSHDRELAHYRDALQRLEPTLDRPLPGETAEQRLFAWTMVRHDALACGHHDRTARGHLLDRMRSSPAEAAYGAKLERASMQSTSVAPYVDWVATCLDFPEIVDEDAGDLVRQMRQVDPGPMISADRHLLGREAWLLASTRWTSERDEPGGKKDHTRRDLIALHDLRQLDPADWRAPSTRELDQMISYALDGLVNQTKVLSDVFKAPLEDGMLQRAAAPALMTLSLLISQTQPLLVNLLDERRPPVTRIKLIRGISALDRLSRKQAPRRRARLTATVQLCAQRPAQRWVTDLFEARRRHEDDDHAVELKVYAESFRDFEKRYFQDKPKAELPPDIVKAWVELRSGLLKACSRRKDEPALQAIVHDAQAASRFDTEHIDELAAACVQHADDLTKLRDDERAANRGK